MGHCRDRSSTRAGVMLLLAYPRQGLLKRYETGLDAGGARTQFTDKLLGHPI